MKTKSNLKSTLGVVLIAVAVSVLCWLALPAKVTQEAGFGAVAYDGGTQANLTNPSNYDYLVARLASGLGTATTPIVQEGAKMTLVAATTTPCALQNPYNATTTIQSFTMNITVGTSSASVIAVGTSTSAFATSSSMSSTAVAGNALATISWDPSVNNAILGPSQWVVAGSGSGSAVAYGYTYGGTCQMTVQSVT